MQMFRSMRLAQYIAPLALVTLAACSSDNSTNPGGGLSAAERTALTSLFARPAVAQAMFAGGTGYSGFVLPAVVTNLQSLGTVQVTAPTTNRVVGDNGNFAPRFAVASTGNYRAFGGQFLISYKYLGTETKLAWSGIVAVNNLENPTDVIVIGISDANATSLPTSVPNTETGTSGTRYVYGSYVQIAGQTATPYMTQNRTGGLGISTITFNNGTNCAGIAQVPQIKTCNNATGKMAGRFSFSATQLGGSATVQVPEMSFDVPAVRMTLALEI